MAAEDGVIIDAVTGAPILGVFVVADWRGTIAQVVQPATRCYGVKLTRSGDDGRYHVDLLSGNFNPLIGDRQRAVVLFKPGYEIKVFTETVEKRTSLRPFAGTFQDRLEQYSQLWARDCPEAQATLRPLLEAINAEAKSLARSPQEREKAAYYQLQLDTASMGHDAAHRRYEEHLRAIRSQTEKK